MVVKIISDLYDQKECYNPCSYSEIELADLIWRPRGKKYISVRFNFNDSIKETKSYYTYTLLSLIAEIGGYVGLFLGVSVNMINTPLKFLAGKIVKLMKTI